MSHFKERKEKNCLNCNAQVAGRFCQVCGQENLEPKESVGHLLSHFFNDITHFDGKVFSSLKLLILKPGFLAKEYMIGRRARHLNPVRMYILITAIFFAVFFIVFGGDRINNMGIVRVKPDSADAKKSKNPISSEHPKYNGINIKVGRDTSFKPKTLEQYDSFQHTLPPNKRDNWLNRKLQSSSFKLYDSKTGTENNELENHIVERFMHTIPQQMLVTLPFFALLLKLLYWRKKEYYYTDHAIFAVYLYIFTYLAALVLIAFASLDDLFFKSFWAWMQLPVIFSIFFYEYKAMKNFYAQGTGKTILKFVMVNIGSLFFTIVLFCIYFLFFFINLK